MISRASQRDLRCNDRRTFLKAAAVGAAGAVANVARSLAAAAADAAPEAMVIDTHTHFYDPTRPQGVPWPGKDDKLLYRRVLPEHYRAVTRGQGVAGTVVVEASPWVEDNQWLLDLAAKEPLIVGVVGHLTPAAEDYRKHLERFAKNPLFRGIRIAADLLRRGLDQARFLDDLRLLARHDRTLDVNGGPDLPADVARLAKLVPELRVVINHAANVPIDGKAPPPGWLEGMRAAAKQPNVVCKVSALVEGTGRKDGRAPAEVAFYRPVLDALWDTFGADRLLYGSNWPVSERFAGYTTVQAIVRAYFQAKGKVAMEKFFRGNSLAVYKWVKQRS